MPDPIVSDLIVTILYDAAETSPCIWFTPDEGAVQSILSVGSETWEKLAGSLPAKGDTFCVAMNGDVLTGVKPVSNN